MKRALAVLAALTLTAAAAPALAEKTPVSEIPLLRAPADAKTPPKTYGVPGLKITEHQGTGSSSSYELTAATKQGYCLVQDENAAFLSLTDATFGTDASELWRLTEKDGAATLERTRFELVTYLENAWVKSKASVALRAVANENGVTVWSTRQPNGDLVFLAKGADGGREAHLGRNDENGGTVVSPSSSCTFGATQIDANTVSHGGGVAQLTGNLPAVGEGKDRVIPRFSVDISAVRVSRDPEPVITVRVRVRNI